MLTVIEHGLVEVQGVDRRGRHKRGDRRGVVWIRVTVANPLQVFVREWRDARSPVLFLHGDRHVGEVFVLVDEFATVSLVVVAPFGQPTEDARGLLRVGNTRPRRTAEDGDYVFTTGNLPIEADFSGQRYLLDARNLRVNSWTIPFDARVPVEDDVANPASAAVLHIRRYEILGASEDENVALCCILVAWQLFVGSSLDRRKGEVPTQAERAVPGTGAVVEVDRAVEATARLGKRHGYRQLARPVRGIYGKFLVNRPQCAPAFGQGELRCREGGPGLTPNL